MKDKDVALIANSARQEVISMLVQAKSGHTAGPLGMADVFTLLYYDWLRIDPVHPDWPERDYVFLSNGHICAIWYVTLANRGFFGKDHLQSFRKINSLLQGHPHSENTPGVENSGGPLAQGISQAVGAALALKRDGKPNRVYCLCSDGEHQEGQAWEAAMFAGNHQLDNLCFIMDRNNIQIDGFTDEIMDIEPLRAKYEAFKWNVIEVDGHSLKHLRRALARASKARGKPTMIIAKTIPGKGVSFIESKFEWHGKPPSEQEGEKALAELRKERERIEKQRWGW